MESENVNAEITEIIPGLTLEEMKALFFDKGALKEPNYRLYQLNGDGQRYYYRFRSDGSTEYFPSVTTLLKQTMPTSPFLIKWMVENGEDGATEKRDLAAAYGSFMHGQFEQLIINRSYDYDKSAEQLRDYMKANNLPDKFFNENVLKIQKDVCAFAQFVRDYQIRPLAVEVALVHPDYHYAGMIDLPCVMVDPKTGEEFPAIIDFKSGRKGFWEEHEIQLHLYKEMWNVNYPELRIERVFNFSPKDWRKKPSYNLKEQTDSVNAKKIPALLTLAMIEDEKQDRTFTVISGVVNLDDYKPDQNIMTLSLDELIKFKQSKSEKPETKDGFEPRIGMPKNNEIPDWLKTDTEKVEKWGKSEPKDKKPINVSTEPDKPLKSNFSENLLNSDIEL